MLVLARLVIALFGLGLMACPSASAAPPAKPAPVYCHDIDGVNLCIHAATYTADVCQAIATVAPRWKLPEAFLARLIWQESRFDPQAISPVGAQGIAQFMAGTARLRDLYNPFNPAAALAKSAQYLRELELKFGNLGLAAAAYNAGEGRISRVRASGSFVPAETRAYVSTITGRPVDDWLIEPPPAVDYTLSAKAGFIESCVDMASAAPMPDFGLDPARWQPWGVLLAQNYSRDTAVRRWKRAQTAHSGVLGDEDMLLVSVRNPSFGPRTRFSAMVGRPTRREAQQLCSALLAAGGNCIVQKNGR